MADIAALIQEWKNVHPKEASRVPLFSVDQLVNGGWVNLSQNGRFHSEGKITWGAHNSKKREVHCSQPDVWEVSRKGDTLFFRPINPGGGTYRVRMHDQNKRNAA
jgi:hypothetical protein